MFEKIKNKIKAIFNIGGEDFVLELDSAQIEKGVAYLKPENDKNTTYIVKNKNVDILFNSGEAMQTDDILVITSEDKPKNSENGKEEKLNDSDNKNQSNISKNSPNNKTKKTKITFTVYEDEKALIDKIIKDSGYKRADYFIACIQNNMKKSVVKSFDVEYARVNKARKERFLV